MGTNKTREKQYQNVVTLKEKKGLSPLGAVVNLVWHENPKHLFFMMARYKFVAKMLSGKKRVLEVGCGDAFCSRIVRQEVKHLTAVDFDPIFIKDAKERMEREWKFECFVHDIISCPVKGKYDAAYAIDVLEHIPKVREGKFMKHVTQSLVKDGVLIIGMPSRQSQVYASARSKQGHVNCKDDKQLKQLMDKHFKDVFIFSMNDEVIHTGFYPMAHYLFALCVGKK